VRAKKEKGKEEKGKEKEKRAPKSSGSSFEVGALGASPVQGGQTHAAKNHVTISHA
jgi:hypothetical protein